MKLAAVWLLSCFLLSPPNVTTCAEILDDDHHDGVRLVEDDYFVLSPEKKDSDKQHQVSFPKQQEQEEPYLKNRHEEDLFVVVAPPEQENEPNDPALGFVAAVNLRGSLLQEQQDDDYEEEGHYQDNININININNKEQEELLPPVLQQGRREIISSNKKLPEYLIPSADDDGHNANHHDHDKEESMKKESEEPLVIPASSFSSNTTDPVQQQRKMVFEQRQYSPPSEMAEHRHTASFHHQPAQETSSTKSFHHVISSSSYSSSTTTSSNAGVFIAEEEEISPASSTCQLRLYERPAGVNNWYQANAFCKRKGGAGSRLARLREYCPRGRTRDPAFGKKGGDNWSPYFEDKNGWVQVGTWPGNGETCVTHFEATQVNPSWGIDNAKENYESNYVYCYECPGTCEVKLHYDSTGTGVLNTWDKAKSFCESQDGGPGAGSRLATFEENCPDGMFKRPLFEKPGDNWMAIGDHRNAWVQIGTWPTDGNTCMTHLAATGSNPGWGMEDKEYSYKTKYVHCYQCTADSLVGNIEAPHRTSSAYLLEMKPGPDLQTIKAGVDFPIGLADATFDAARLSMKINYDRNMYDGWKDPRNELIRYREGFDYLEVFKRPEEPTFQSIVAKSRGVCFGVISSFDKKRHLSHYSVETDVAGCWVHDGFHGGYNNAYRSDFEASLNKCLKSCGDTECPLVFTGYDQGGSAAAIASVYWESKNPIVITFGSLRAVNHDCKNIHGERHYRFIATGPISGHHMGYDIACNLVERTGARHFGFPILMADDIQYNDSPLIYELDNDWNLDPSCWCVHKNDGYVRKAISFHYHTLMHGGQLKNNKWGRGAACREGFQCASGQCTDWYCA